MHELKKNWKGIYEYICWDRALVLWKKEFTRPRSHRRLRNTGVKKNPQNLLRNHTHVNSKSDVKWNVITGLFFFVHYTHKINGWHRTDRYPDRFPWHIDSAYGEPCQLDYRIQKILEFSSDWSSACYPVTVWLALECRHKNFNSYTQIRQ